MVTRPGSSTDLVVAPGADVGRIQLRFDGAASERVDDNGDLVMRLADAEVRQFRPVVYQEWDNGRHLLSARYVLDAAGHVGFEITGGRADKTLIIDPVLAYSSFLGGSGIDVGHAVAVDGNDNLYVTGATYSTDFPTVNPQQPFNAGGADAFVTKLDPTGTVELFSSYLGGSGQENDYNPAWSHLASRWTPRVTFIWRDGRTRSISPCLTPSLAVIEAATRTGSSPSSSPHGSTPLGT